MQKKNNTLLVFLLFLFITSCMPTNETEYDSTQGDTLEYIESTMESTSDVEISPTGTQTKVYKKCKKQPSLEGQELPLQVSTLNLDSREIEFQDSLEIEHQVQNVLDFELDESTRHYMIELAVFFINSSGKDIIVRIPKNAFNDLTASGLLVGMKNIHGASFTDLDIGYDDILPIGIDNFVRILPEDYHCETYTLNWSISTPGIHYIYVSYHNITYDVHFEGNVYDLNAWVGFITSELKEIDLR